MGEPSRLVRTNTVLYRTYENTCECFLIIVEVHLEGEMKRCMAGKEALHSTPTLSVSTIERALQAHTHARERVYIHTFCQLIE